MSSCVTWRSNAISLAAGASASRSLRSRNWMTWERRSSIGAVSVMMMCTRPLGYVTFILRLNGIHQVFS